MQTKLTPAVKALLILTIGAYFADLLLARAIGFELKAIFALIPRQTLQGHFYQLFTYAFLHSPDPFHIIFNMLIFWALGVELEQAWGSRRFVIFYFWCVLGGGLAALFTGNAVVGASGGVMGVLVAYAFMWPDRQFLFFFVIPMRAKYLVIVTIFIELAFGLSGNTGISHWAYLGGIAFAALYIGHAVYRYRSGGMRATQTPVWRGRPISQPADGSLRARWYRWRQKRKNRRQQARIQQRIDLHNQVEAILDKISQKGMQNLTRAERRLLDRASAELGNVEYPVKADDDPAR